MRPSAGGRIGSASPAWGYGYDCRMTARLLPITTALATCALALGYGLGGLWAGALLILGLGSLWLLGQSRGWSSMASVALVLFVGAGAAGLWLGLAGGWMLPGVVAALSAWDLDHFAQRLRSAGRVDRVRELERRHIRRLLIVDGLGLVLAVAALGIKVRFGFGVAFFLGLLAALSLSLVIGSMRREGD